MLIAMADVPRWYAERKPKDTIAIVHGTDTLTWEQLECGANRRARAFAAKGVKPGDFVAIGLPNGNGFFETSFAVWKCGATPTSLSWRLPRGEAAAVLDILKPSLVVGGEADWNAPVSLPVNFVPDGFSGEPIAAPIARYWKAMTSGGSTGRPKVILDHQPAVTDTAAEPPLGIPREASLLNPGPLYHNAPFILSHFALFAGGRLTGMVKFDAEETLRLIEAQRVQWVNFVPTMMHRIWSLPESVRNAHDLSSLKVVFHMAAPMPPWLKEKWIAWLGPEKIYELYGGTERQGRCVISGVEWLQHRGSVGKIDETCKLRILDADGRDVAPVRAARYSSCPMTAPAVPITISAPSRSAARMAGSRSAILADSMPTVIFIWAIASPIWCCAAAPTSIQPRSKPPSRPIPTCAPVWWSACPTRSSANVCTRSSNSTQRPTHRPSPTAWRTSWPTG